jgi:uncharacterized membrane protein
MPLNIKPFTTTLVGGLVFLLPLVVVLAVLGHGLALMNRVAEPLAAMFPDRQVGGVAVASLVAMLLLLVVCYGAGLLARMALGRSFSASLEDRLQTIYPRYTVIKGMTQALGIEGVRSSLKTVLVDFDDHQAPGLEVERTADGRVVVFLPGAPDPWSGNVVVVSHERVGGLPADIGALNRSMKRIGHGCAAMLDGSRASVSTNASER